MKRLTKICVLSLTLALAACNNDACIVAPQNDSQNSSQLRTNEELIQIAAKAASMFNTESRALATPGSIRLVPVKTTASRSLSDTVLYAANYENSQGFALIPADRRLEPIIGYVENGNYSEESIAENPSFEYYIDNTLNYLNSRSSLRDSIGFTLPIVDIYDPWTVTLLDYIAPQLSVEWGNIIPEGIYCSNQAAGCVQVAMAQICSFFEAPSSLDLTYPERDMDKISISWTELKKHSKSEERGTLAAHLDTCSASEYHHKILARMCREFGHRNNANYNKPYVTSASSYTARINLSMILPHYNIGEFESFNDDSSNLYEEMSKKRCVAYVRGTDPELGGHAWVCDGVKVFHTIYDPKRSYPGNYYDVINRYYHFNWGFSGNCNGYFLAGVFDWEKGIENPSRANCYRGAEFFTASFK